MVQDYSFLNQVVSNELADRSCTFGLLLALGVNKSVLLSLPLAIDQSLRSQHLQCYVFLFSWDLRLPLTS